MKRRTQSTKPNFTHHLSTAAAVKIAHFIRSQHRSIRVEHSPHCKSLARECVLHWSLSNGELAFMVHNSAISFFFERSPKSFAAESAADDLVRAAAVLRALLSLVW